jgi:hypothetical protein
MSEDTTIHNHRCENISDISFTSGFQGKDGQSDKHCTAKKTAYVGVTRGSIEIVQNKLVRTDSKLYG